MPDEGSAMRYWLVKGQPRNNFDERLQRTHPDRWGTKRPIPKDMAAGDRVFLYESSPKQRLVGLAEVANPHAGRDETYNHFTLKYLTQRFTNMPRQSDLRLVPGLEGASFLKPSNAATIYRVSDEEAGLLSEIVYQANPEVANVWRRDPAVFEETSLDVNIDELLAFREGDPVLRVHYELEREPRLVKEKKADVISKTGRLACEVCDFDFRYSFGSRGDDFCEVHHRKPLSRNPPAVTSLDDLAIVCSNCHRMLHKQPWTSVEELRSSIRHMRPTVQYRGLEGSILYSAEDHLLHGKILGIRGMYIYDGSDLESIVKHFRESVDDYLESAN